MVAFYECGLPRSFLLERFAFLLYSCAKEDPVLNYIKRVLEREEFESFNDWFNGSDAPEDTHESGEAAGAGNLANPDDENFVFFLAAHIPGLASWEFHQADPDYFPSVPHGHWQGKKQPKLDAYLGWVYQGSKQIRRESRKDIIALWNDPKFRSFALIAVNYYKSTFDHYKGWRVSNPLRLPRRR